MGCSSSAALVDTSVTPITAQSAKGKTTPIDEDFRGRYKVGNKIGVGSFGQVYIGHCRKPCGGDVAIKVLSLCRDKSNDGGDYKACISACKEVSLWNRVGSHPNCVNMRESFFDGHFCYIVMELCDTTLFHYIESHVVNERSLAKVFTQMLRGIDHLHSVDVVHRDIKPGNFLVGGGSCHTIKLADFGMSAYAPCGSQVGGVCGTAPYMCPEMLLHGAANLKADIWSFGTIVYMLFCGQFPYMGSKDTPASMKKAIATGSPPRCKRVWLSKSAVRFVTQLLNRDPESRPSAKLTLNMPYLTEPARPFPSSLRPMLYGLVEVGAFVPKDLNSTTQVDDFFLQGAGNVCKKLAQSQMDEFITASPRKIDQFVKDFWLPCCIERDAQVTSSNASTCAGTNTSASNGTFTTI